MPRLTEAEAEQRAKALQLTVKELCKSYGFDGMAIIGVQLPSGGKPTSQMTFAACGVEATVIAGALQDALDRVCATHGLYRRDAANDDDDERTAVLPGNIDPTDYIIAGRCPECRRNVLGPRVKPPGGQLAAGVCACGTFLIPTYGDDNDSAPTGVAVMTLEQIGMLPDHVRSELVRIRRDGYCTGIETE